MRCPKCRALLNCQRCPVCGERYDSGIDGRQIIKRRSKKTKKKTTA